jgi:hypothetical protein
MEGKVLLPSKKGTQQRKSGDEPVDKWKTT